MNNPLSIFLLIFLALTMSAQAEISHIEHRNNFYHIYNEQGRLCKTLSTSIGDIIAVSGTTFTVRTKSGFMSVYNSKGEKVKQ